MLQFFVQGAAVTDNAAQVPLHPHELVPGASLCIFHDVLRKTHFASQFESERIARKADFQLEERLNLGCVELHCAIYHPGI